MHLDGLNCFEVHFSHEHPLQLFINLIRIYFIHALLLSFILDFVI